jgi:class 3 adenylate cyclase/tetratricopeptide (TPR) repeat protein
VEATVDVGVWLGNLGLGQYEAAFRENAIDGDILLRLTADDLKDLGLTIVGHRRKLLDAIAALNSSPPAQVVPSSLASPPSTPTQKAAEVAAERRPVTVMFCDLVGSTALASRLDAEDWRDLVSGYLDAASEAVAQMGGRVATKLGDGLMALFGHPIAQENDSERAVRAALAIQRALAALNRNNAGLGRPELAARIGIESGAVVVDAAGEIFGDAPNSAARVQTLADPGTVLITARVQRQVAGLFVAEDRGVHELKGVPTPVALYQIVRASGGRRFGARALTPLVGREEELDLLRRRWERAMTGEGQLALVVGEPGIGKSRLVEEFRLKLAETPHTWAEFSSSQLLQNTPLHPIAEWGRQRFGADEPAARRLADLEKTLRLIGLDSAEYAPLLAPLVDIPLPEERAAKLAPEELRRRQFAALIAWFLAGARSQPGALVFEDLHWADPTSLDLMQALAERGRTAPLFIIATARPEFHPPWSLRSHHSVISLGPLDRADVAQMVGELASRHALSQEVVDGVSERTGGVPLFVEEVTRLLLERGEPGGLQAIPPTLQQSLAARLDRLGEAREVAQIGAVLGRDFTYALVRAVGGIDDPALQSALDRLAAADLFIAAGAGQEANYRFKHALIQDAAYESLLRSRRQALHRRAAELLRDQPERDAAEPEVIAHHFTQAGLDDLAIEWWGKAGDQALRRSAFQEAIAHLGKAIAMADKADGGKAACDLGGRAQLHVAYGNALFAVRGQGAPETTEAFARARERAGGDNDVPERLAADYGLWAGSYQRGELSAMRAQAETFLSDVGARPDSPEAGVAHRTAGITHWFAGEYREAREHLEQALALFQPGRDDGLAFRFGFLDSGVGAMALLPMTLWPLGDIERAVSLERDADARNAALPHAGGRAHGKGVVAMFALMRGDLSRAASNGVELVQLAREHDLSLVLGLGVFLEGVAMAESGAAADGLEQMRRGELLRGTSFPSYDGVIKIALAQAEARAGDVDRATAILDEALATVRRTGCRAFEADLNRVHGEMLLKRDPTSPAPAEEAFRTAVAIARRQAARSFELRAALGLAKLYQSTGRPAEAYAVLAPALEGFPALERPAPRYPPGRRDEDEGSAGRDTASDALISDPSPKWERGAVAAEMPEIAEAQALLAALAEMQEVRAATAQRQRRGQLLVAYGNALIGQRGMGASEAMEAFARARDYVAGDKGAPERLAIHYGLWAGSFLRGELSAMREHVEAFFSDVEANPDSREAGVAHRTAGMTHWFAGEYREAREHLECALALFQPGRDDDLAFRFAQDAGVAAMNFLALTLWPLGAVERARSLVESARKRSASVTHIGTHAYEKALAAWFELMRGDLVRAVRNGVELTRLAGEHDLPFWRLGGVFFEGLAKAESGALGGGLEDMRRGAEMLRERNIVLYDGLLKILLAETEARAGDVDCALVVLDEALATCGRTGYRSFEAELRRVRGDMLLKRDPTNPAPPEDALRSAIAVAQRQGTRSFELRAALSLAKLYQSTGRPADAQAVLAPALEGCSPTPEMPEIAEAMSRLARLA